MPDPVADAAAAVTARLLAAHPADRPRSRADLDALPTPVAGRLRATLDGRVDAAFPSTPWVDGADAEVEAAARTWRAAARAAARVPAEAWADALADAVGEALGHLVRPARALAAEAFRGEAEDGGDLPTDMAIERARAFGPFPYLPEIAARYVDRKGAERIDRAGLERLLDRIDRRMTEPFGANEWATLLGPLYDVVGPAVPAGLLREAFRARGATALADAFDGDDDVSADALRRRAADALPESAAAPDETATPPSESDDEPDEARPAERGGAEPASGHGEEEAVEPAPPDAGGPAEAERDDSVDVPSPPVVGSRWQSPEETFTGDSDVLGDPRPAAPPEPAAEGSTAEGVDVAPPETEGPEAEDVASSQPADPSTVEAAEPEGEARSAPADTSEAAPPESAADDGDAAPPDDGLEAVAPPDESEPLWRRIARQRGVDVVESAADDAPDAGGAAPLWQRFAAPAPADDEPARPTPDALDAVERRVLGPGVPERRDEFVRALFGGSTDDYHRTLVALDGVRTWTEATQVIARDVFKKHRVNIYSDPAVAFTDAVEAHVTHR